MNLEGLWCEVLVLGWRKSGLVSLDFAVSVKKDYLKPGPLVARLSLVFPTPFTA